jgi:hypothetical protein
MANKVALIPSKDISKHLSQDDKVQKAVKARAQKMARMGKVLLSMHRKTGAHKVNYEGHRATAPFGHIDHYVVLDGPAPISVEFGHRAKNGKWVHGLYIMTRAMLTP